LLPTEGGEMNEGETLSLIKEGSDIYNAIHIFNNFGSTTHNNFYDYILTIIKE